MKKQSRKTIKRNGMSNQTEVDNMLYFNYLNFFRKKK